MASRDTKLKIIIDAENRSQGVFNDIKGNLDGIRRSHEGLISTMKTVGTAGAVALGGLSYLTKGIIEAGASFEQTSIAFNTMIGDAETAREVLSDLAKFAARTPFELTQIEDASKRLLAYGVTVDELLPTLKMLGDISSGVGMDKLPNLILAFGQVRAATKLTGMELRQFTEAGVPLLEELAKVTGMSVEEMAGNIGNLDIPFAQVQQALQNLTGEGGRFFNLMQAQSRSAAGLWSNFKDQISLTARAIGLELLPYLKPVLDSLIGIAQAVGEWVKTHPQLAALLLVAVLGFTALLAVLLPIAIALPGLILMWTGLGAALAFIASGPGVAIVAALFVIGTTLTKLIEQGYFTKQAWEEVWLGMKLIAAETANTVIGVVESMINFIISGINFAIRAINKVIALAQKVPGIGKKFSTIAEIGPAEFGRYDTDLITSNALSGTRSTRAIQNQIAVTGNMLLSEDAAEKLGDLILGRLKMSNAL